MKGSLRGKPLQFEFSIPRNIYLCCDVLMRDCSVNAEATAALTDWKGMPPSSACWKAAISAKHWCASRRQREVVRLVEGGSDGRADCAPSRCRRGVLVLNADFSLTCRVEASSPLT